MIRPPNTGRHFKPTLSLTFSLAGLIFLIVLPGGLFWEFHSPIDQGSLVPDRGDTSVPPVPKAAAGVSSDTLLAPDAVSKARISKTYGQLPLSFEVNEGQVDAQVRFTSRGSGYSLYLTASEAVLALRRSADTARASSADLTGTQVKHPQPEVLRMKLTGASAAPEIKGVNEQPGKSNYFIGNDPQKWQTNVAHYAGVQYTGVYPGVDLVYYGNQRQLEYDFVVAPGFDPNVITLSFDGVDDLRINADGDLLLRTATGEVTQRKPIVYQEMDGERHELACRYKIRGDREIGFELAGYDTTKPLVIDPVLSYSSYLGGSGSDVGYDIAVDSSGNAYITGATKSVNFPVVNSLPYGDRDGGSEDVFITKLNAAGSALVYSTYLGGNGGDRALAIALDSSGNPYVTGYTVSSNFPTANPLQSALRGFRDAFVTKLNSTGSALVYSTYLGGTDSNEETRGIAVDSSGSAYVTGYTRSTDFPLANPLQPVYGGWFSDAFLTKLNPAGSGLVYSTYLGGVSFDQSNSVAVDSAGNAYVTGSTYSSDFPITNALQPTCGCSLGNCGGDGDVFVTKVNPTGSALVYSTYLGGNGVDEGRGIAVDSTGNVYVTGSTGSTNFPTANPLQATYTGSSAFCNQPDTFVTKLNAAGSSFIYSTYLGGYNSDSGNGIAVDSMGNAYVTGETNGGSSGVGTPTANAPQSTFGGGGSDVFITKLNPIGSALVYYTYLGGSTYDVGSSIAIDSVDNAYVTGFTQGNFPTEKPFQSFFGGGNPNLNENNDVFIARIGEASPPPTVLSISAVTPNRGGNNGSVSFTVHGSGFANGATVKLLGAGHPDIVATAVGVSDDGTVARFRFDFTGQAPGVRDVVVANPGGASVTLERAFIVEAGGQPEVWVDIIGRDQIRPGRPQTYYILYGNRGNTDAFGVPLWITGIPKDVLVNLGFVITPPPQLAGHALVDYGQVPVVIETPTEKVIPLYLPIVRVGDSVSLKITLTVPTEKTFELQAFALPPQYDPNANQSTIIVKPHSASNLGERSVATSSNQGGKCFRAILGLALDLFPFPPPLACAANVLSEGLQIQEAIQTEALNGSGPGPFFSFTQITVGAGSIAVSCFEGFTTAGLIGNAQTALSGIGVVSGCVGGFVGRVGKSISTVLSIDPNDKVGSQGVGASRYLSDREPLRYAIYFENKPDATAPAQDVVITDQLDASKVDFNTFSLGPISFGADKSVVPPPGLSEFKKDVDLRPAKNLIVRVEARLDKTTGLLTWRFTSLDPTTLQPTEDPLAGFLPPNVIANEGEGQVLFTVRPKEGLGTGTEIRNRARIVFDTNAPIDTPEWLNTIDYSKPASQVSALAATQSSNSFTVGWSGTDTGSGIQSYTIFVAENGGPFNVWQRDTVATSGIFIGRADTTYAFYSVARDGTGNQEDPPTSADATTRTLPADTTAPVLTLPSTITKEATSPAGAVVTYTASVTDDRDASATISCTPSSGEMFRLGSTSVTCTATDAAGNRAQASFIVNVVDTRAPSITIPADIATNATTPAGTTVSYTASATDIVDTNPTLTCSSASGSTFQIGQTVVTCTAVDDFGNRASRTFRVIVRGPMEQLTDLMSLVRSFKLQYGIENSLLAQLQSASDASRQGRTTAGCGSLNAFSNYVQSQDAKKIGVTQANQLLIAANRIRTVLGCG